MTANEILIPVKRLEEVFFVSGSQAFIAPKQGKNYIIDPNLKKKKKAPRIMSVRYFLPKM